MSTELTTPNEHEDITGEDPNTPTSDMMDSEHIMQKEHINESPTDSERQSRTQTEDDRDISSEAQQILEIHVGDLPHADDAEISASPNKAETFSEQSINGETSPINDDDAKVTMTPPSPTKTDSLPRDTPQEETSAQSQTPKLPDSPTKTQTHPTGKDARRETSSKSPSTEASQTPTTPMKPRVSIQDEKASTPKRVSSSRLRMERELARLKQAEERERLQQKEKRKKEVQKAVEAVRRERETRGVTLTPDVEASRAAIRHIVREEERMALAKDQKKLQNETKALQQQIENKYSLKDKKPDQDMVALAESFHHGKVQDKDGIPQHVQRQLTRQEIEDLRTVFDMFDVKGKGYIVPDDVRRAAGMLGFKAKKEVFIGMIEEVTGDKNGRVTFAHFLHFVVKGQRDGDDPLEDILQCFRLLDHDQKGYITASDLRHAADSQKVPLSNRAIREMIQEADVSGDSKVTSDEFIHLMLQSSMFRVSH